MTGDRMRRVDEAMREVLSGAITSELKDPRVGFVTVTSVETSPDLRQARVFVSVLGNRGRAPALARRPATPRTATCSAAWPTSCASSTRRRSTSSTTTRPTGRCGSPSCSKGEDRPDGRTTARVPSREQDPAAIRAADRFFLTTHERPDGDAVGSLAAMQQVAGRAGQGRGGVPAGGRVPAALRVPLHPSRRAGDRAAGGPLRARDGVPGLREHRPHAGRALRKDDGGAAASSTSTTTTTTRASGRSTTSTRTRRARPRWCGT